MSTEHPLRRRGPGGRPACSRCSPGSSAAAVALGVAELLAGLNRAWRSPVLDVGDRLIDAAPPFVKEFAIDTFGTNDKPALLIGIGAAPRGLRRGSSASSRSAATSSSASSASGLFGVIGAWAAPSRRIAPPWHVVLPSVIGAAAGIGALWLRASVLAPAAGTARQRPRRRRIDASSCATPACCSPGWPATAAVVGVAGRWLGSRFAAAASRAGVTSAASGDAARRGAAIRRRSTCRA